MTQIAYCTGCVEKGRESPCIVPAGNVCVDCWLPTPQQRQDELERADFRDSLIGFTHVATASGLPDTAQALALMLTALALADRHYPSGCDEETFVRMARKVYETSRRALSGGVQA